MDNTVIFIRKKIIGENSIEEFAYRISQGTGAKIIELPYDSVKIKSILKNIMFARKHQGIVNHIVNASEGYLLPFLRNKKIITYHDLGTLSCSRNKLYKMMKFLFYVIPSKKYADFITFVSEQTKNEYIKKCGNKNMDKLRVIHNSYDERLIFFGRSKKNDKRIILHIGTGARKNLEGLVQASEGLDIRLLVVGKLTDIQKKLLREKNIDFENYFDLPFEKIVALYNLCDVVSFPTFYEGFGMPIIEANIMQKPVISSDIPIVHEVGKDAVYYINPKDSKTIRSAILDLIEHPEVYKNYVKLGIQNAKRFSPEVIINQYKRIYEGI